MKEKDQHKESEPVVYIPPGAELNFETMKKDPPKTKYEKRRAVFRREEGKKITKGRYGRDG